MLSPYFIVKLKVKAGIMQTNCFSAIQSCNISRHDREEWGAGFSRSFMVIICATFYNITTKALLDFLVALLELPTCVFHCHQIFLMRVKDCVEQWPK
jgi:hypothetical protein